MQIGRFWGVDPASQFPSGYTGMGNDPANKIDPSGCYANGAPFAGNNNVEMGNDGEGRYSDLFGMSEELSVDNLSSQADALSKQFAQQLAALMAIAGQSWSSGAGDGGAAEQNSSPNSGNSGANAPVAQLSGSTQEDNSCGSSASTASSANPNDESSTDLLSSLANPDPQADESTPNMDQGGVIRNDKDFYSFMVNAANNAQNRDGKPCEVAAWGVVDPNTNQTVYVIQPWANNKLHESDNFGANVVPYGYSPNDISAQFHTHPSSSTPSAQDWELSKSWSGLPINTIGADGQVYMIMYPRVSRLTPVNVTYMFKTQ